MSTFCAASSCTALRPSASLRDPVGRVGAAGLRHRDAASRGAKSARAGERFRAHLERQVARVLAQAHRGADAEVRAAAQVVRRALRASGSSACACRRWPASPSCRSRPPASRPPGTHVAGTAHLGDAVAGDNDRRVLDGGRPSPAMTRAPSKTIVVAAAGDWPRPEPESATTRPSTAAAVKRRSGLVTRCMETSGLISPTLYCQLEPGWDQMSRGKVSRTDEGPG